MTHAERQLRLEFAYEILERLQGDLYNSGAAELADELQEILRQMILFSNMLKFSQEGDD